VNSNQIAMSPTKLALLKQRHGAEFRASLREAIDALSPRERNVLRLHLLEGMSLEEVGRVYDAHRASVARWIARARTEILADTRKRLSARLRLQEGEFDSLMGLVRSDLDQSLRRYFRK
jgi:RNA polymerase sigma-70 factor, ECF subfamily